MHNDKIKKVIYMRMRKKPNLGIRMERCSSVQIKEPEKLKGQWLSGTSYSKLFLEIGCGKGRFTAEKAKTLPDTLYIGVERVPDAMVMGMERVVREEINNVRFIDMDASKLTDVFAPGEIDRIYINFCDPWPSNRHAKRRLTSPLFLAEYKMLLKPGGEIHFKTDNQDLFSYSLETFATYGWEVQEETRNLHEFGIRGIMTDYEEKFYNQGLPICRCIAIYRGLQNDEI